MTQSFLSTAYGIKHSVVCGEERKPIWLGTQRASKKELGFDCPLKARRIPYEVEGFKIWGKSNSLTRLQGAVRRYNHKEVAAIHEMSIRGCILGTDDTYIYTRFMDALRHHHKNLNSTQPNVRF